MIKFRTAWEIGDGKGLIAAKVMKPLGKLNPQPEGGSLDGFGR